MLLQTRGLLEVKVRVPLHMDKDGFTWLKGDVDSLPGDAHWFIDGSLFEGGFKQFRCTGFAVVVVGRNGDLLAYGRGVPPGWIEDAAAAEAWAYQVIMSLLPTSPSVVTDCLNIVQTMKKGMKSDLGEKSPLARICQMVYLANDSADLSEEQLRELVWMPAHGSIASVGVATMSDGNKVSILQWRANRLVDLLAKSAAKPFRIHEKTRATLQDACDSLEFSLGMLGVATYAANNHKTSIQMPDGTTRSITLRDSAGIKAIRGSRAASGVKRKAPDVAAIPDPGKKLCIPVSCDLPAVSVSDCKRRRTASKIKQAAADYEAACELRFRTNWRTDKSPLRPSSNRPVSIRMAELRDRIFAKEQRDRTSG